MNILQVRDFLDRLMADGVPTDTPLCVVVEDLPVEVAEAELLTGRFQKDPAPKMPGWNPQTGQFLLLGPWNADRFSVTEEGAGYTAQEIADES